MGHFLKGRQTYNFEVLRITNLCIQTIKAVNCTKQRILESQEKKCLEYN